MNPEEEEKKREEGAHIMAWATVASDLHQLGQCTVRGYHRLGSRRDRHRAHGLSRALGVAHAPEQLHLSGPALIGKAIVAILTEDEMIQERDAQQLSSFAQPLGQDPIFLAAALHLPTDGYGHTARRAAFIQRSRA